MTKKELALKTVSTLERVYPTATCALEYNEPYQLLVATRLSAQCTDARVNKVTPILFAKYPTLESLANADVADIEKIVHPCGFFRAKAQSIHDMASLLVTRFNSRVPDTMEDLLTLSGVGRKTANLILGDIYHKPAIVADTHFIRITNRLGLTQSHNPTTVENDLRPLIPPEKSAAFCHRVVQFGRDTCRARSPRCTACPLADFCPHEGLA